MMLKNVSGRCFLESTKVRNNAHLTPLFILQNDEISGRKIRRLIKGEGDFPLTDFDRFENVMGVRYYLVFYNLRHQIRLRANFIPYVNRSLHFTNSSSHRAR